MYSFEYFTPDETFYDTYPLVLGLGKSDNDHQLGVNIHYIPYDARIPFLSDVFKSFNFPSLNNISNSSIDNSGKS